MNIESTLNKIFSLHQFDIKLGLERVEKLLEFIGNPQKELKCFHIAGSNGKGSTASFIASILMETGFKVGLYTSPHFVRFNERIRINKNEIDDNYITAFVDSIENILEKDAPTFFEITTALAFKYFTENKVDYVVLETGLGGRLDATNVINPLASIITSISLEHTSILGDTIQKIAEEKAGIIKSGTKVYTGNMPQEAAEVIRSKAEELRCEFNPLDIFATLCQDFVSVALRDKTYHIYNTGLKGFHQLMNSAVAVKTVCDVLSIDDEKIITQGLKNVVENTSIQCRYEVVENEPMIIMDSAHNPEGVKIFIEEFAKECNRYSERVLIFGAMKDKNIPEMLKLVYPFFDKIYLTKAELERSAPIEEMLKIGKDLNMNLMEAEEPNKIIEIFKTDGADKCLVVLGSMYLLGDIKAKIQK